MFFYAHFILLYYLALTKYTIYYIIEASNYQIVAKIIKARGHFMTIKEIARLAGVSISTVSKIVNNKDENINVETRNRVLKIVKDYNYTPYGTVKTTSEAKTFILGVLLRSIPKTNQFLNGALFAAQKNGYSLLLYDSADSISSELKNITSLCKNNIDGVIWEPVNEQSLEYRRYFDEQELKYAASIQDLTQPPTPSILIRWDMKPLKV